MQKTPRNAPQPLDLSDTPADVVAHFWGRVAAPNSTGCRLWTGYVDGQGYGKVQLSGRRVFNAHRVAYALANGPIPSGQIVRHACDNPRCCNPEHLALGSHQENANDRKERGRGWAPGRGDPAYALNADDARTIREIVAAGLDTRHGIAECYGLTYPTVVHILNGNMWRDAGGPSRQEIATAEARRRDDFAQGVRAEAATGTRIKPLARQFGITWRKARDIVQGRGIWAFTPGEA